MKPKAPKKNQQVVIPAQVAAEFCNMLVVETIKMLDTQAHSGLTRGEMYQEFLAKLTGALAYKALAERGADGNAVGAPEAMKRYAATKFLTAEAVAAGFTGAMRQFSAHRVGAPEIEYYCDIRVVPEVKTKVVS